MPRNHMQFEDTVSVHDIHDLVKRYCWDQCTYVGIQGNLELRNCPGCNSTLAKELSDVTQDP